MLIHNDDPDLVLVDVADLDDPHHPTTLRAPARSVIDWANSYLCAAHPELGRPGPVCPYMRAALRSGTARVAVRPGASPAADEVTATVLRFRDWFLELAAGMADPDLLTILIAFPDLPIGRAPELIDDVQDRLKGAFVTEGLMLGQFHPGPPEQAGLWNEEFRPLESPIPLLAIRWMVAGDLSFLTGQDAYVRAYLTRFSDHVERRLVAQSPRKGPDRVH